MNSCFRRFLYQQDSKEFKLYEKTLANLRQQQASTEKATSAGNNGNHGRRPSPKRRVDDDSDDDEPLTSHSPPLPCIGGAPPPPPPWVTASHQQGSSSSFTPRVTADQASRPGALVAGISAPNPSEMNMSAVPPPAELDIGAEADTEDRGRRRKALLATADFH